MSGGSTGERPFSDIITSVKFIGLSIAYNSFVIHFRVVIHCNRSCL